MKSITKLVIPDDISLCVVVVENDSATNCQQHIEELNATDPDIKFIYIHEHNLGIPIARNRACEEALAQHADWIAFIDDDETVYPDWLINMSAAINEYPAEVYYGPVNIILDGDIPDNTRPPKRKSKPTGTYLKKAATNNALVSADFLREHGSILRFDESMRFTGGSDTRFFYQVTDLGGRIRWVDDALANEHVNSRRLTMRWKVSRAYRCGANTTLIHRKRYGNISVIVELFPKSIGRLVKGILMLAAYPIARAFGKARSVKWSHKAKKLIATSTGAIISILGINPNPYKKTD